MNEPRKVHVLRSDGTRIYNFLLDTGGNVIKFDSGDGFVTREYCKRYGWVIVDGWACRQCDIEGMKPSHNGSARCESGSIASGGSTAHCTCDTCF